MADEWVCIQDVELRVGASVVVSMGKESIFGDVVGYTGSQLVLREMFVRPMICSNATRALTGKEPIAEPTGRIYTVFVAHIYYISAMKEDMRSYLLPRS